MISAMGLRRRGLWERIGEFFSSFSCGTQSRKTATRPQRSSGSFTNCLSPIRIKKATPDTDESASKGKGSSTQVCSSQSVHLRRPRSDLKGYCSVPHAPHIGQHLLRRNHSRDQEARRRDRGGESRCQSFNSLIASASTSNSKDNTQDA